jgi:plastocyanin
MRQWRWIASSVVALAIAACGGSGGGYSTGVNQTPGNPSNPSGGGSSNPNEVTLLDQSFSPNAITVPVGTTVRWAWPTCDPTGGVGGYGGTACVTHNVTFDDGSGIVSPTQNSGGFTRTFTTAGVFQYHCGIHGAAVMSGKVTVQ